LSGLIAIDPAPARAFPSAHAPFVPSIPLVPFADTQFCSFSAPVDWSRVNEATALLSYDATYAFRPSVDTAIPARPSRPIPRAQPLIGSSPGAVWEMQPLVPASRASPP
jgi:hypothetical protein